MHRHLGRGRILVSAALGILLSFISACAGEGSDSEGSEDGPYVFYMSLDTAGATAVLSNGLLGGARTAVAHINAKGGINGRQIKLEVANDQNNPTQAVSLLQRRLAKDKPDLVYPGSSSAVTMSMLPILTRNKVLSVGATSSIQVNDPERFPYHFGVSPPGADYVPTFINTARAKGFKKIAMIYSDDASGQSSRKLYEDGAKKAGLQLVTAGYPPNSLDTTSQLQQLRAQNPDALVVNGYGTAALYVLRGRAQLGWTVPSYGDQLASSSPVAGQLTPAQLAGYQVIVQTSSLRSGPQHPGLAAATRDFKASAQAKYLPMAGLALFTSTYDLLEFVAYVAGQQKTTDAKKLTAAFQTFKTPGNPPWVGKGPNGEVTRFEYTAADHFPVTSPQSFRYVRPGGFDADGFYVPGKAPGQ